MDLSSQMRDDEAASPTLICSFFPLMTRTGAERVAYRMDGSMSLLRKELTILGGLLETVL